MSYRDSESLITFLVLMPESYPPLVSCLGFDRSSESCRELYTCYTHITSIIPPVSRAVLILSATSVDVIRPFRLRARYVRPKHSDVSQ